MRRSELDALGVFVSRLVGMVGLYAVGAGVLAWRLGGFGCNPHWFVLLAYLSASAMLVQKPEEREERRRHVG